MQNTLKTKNSSKVVYIFFRLVLEPTYNAVPKEYRKKEKQQVAKAKFEKHF